MKTLLSNISNYTIGRASNKIQYIVIHYTGNNGDTAQSNAKYFTGADRNASAHYFVDENEVYQSVEDKDTAWHAGKWSMNCCSIGIEMCSKKDANGTFYIPQKTQNNAAYLTKQLMRKYNVPIQNVIRHYDVTGKKCPEPFVREPKQWEDFKKLLEDKSNTISESKVDDETMTGEQIYKELNSYLEKQSIPDWAKTEIEEAKKLGITDGTKGMTLIPRYQAAIMAYRAVKELLNK